MIAITFKIMISFDRRTNQVRELSRDLTKGSVSASMTSIKLFVSMAGSNKEKY